MSTPLMKSVAVTIRRSRKYRNMSQEELAHQAGLDRTYISGVERGVRNITIDSLSQIIEALDISNLSFLEAVIREIKSEISDKPEC